jgi:hypothetical protein
VARHRQPISIAELKGDVRHNPQRYRRIVPKSGAPIGSPPGYMGGQARAVWFELAGYCQPGVLTSADRLILEIASNLIAQCRRDPQAFPVAKFRHLTGCLSRLGLSPGIARESCD